MAEKKIRLTDLASCGGCAAKIGLQELTETLHHFTSDEIGIGRGDLLVGLELPDDALVYQIDGERALIQSVDFFPPIVDDPYSYGAIAAANATSDIYAMGGKVLWALNIVAFPEYLPLHILSLILRGGADKITEAGGFVGGGHSIRDDEPKFGMCVTGLTNPRSIWRKGGAKPGDVLFLTKPLGTGLILSAAKQGQANPTHVESAVKSMMLLNRDAAACLHQFRPGAVTDITGFGIIGHAWEVAGQSNVCLELHTSAMPILGGALEYAKADIRTSAHARNKAYLSERVKFSQSPNAEMEAVLFDPQTSGGLLVSISPDHAEPLEHSFLEKQLAIWNIGKVCDGSGVTVTR